MMSETSPRAGEGAANKQLIDLLLRSRLFRDCAAWQAKDPARTAVICGT
jgi:hypothetical protein